MYKYDLMTGAPIMEGAPSELSQDEIVQNANLYDYNANARMNSMMQMQQQQQMMYPIGGVGYNPGGISPNFMNPPMQPGYVQQPGFQGYAGNPAFQYMNNMGMQTPMFYQQPQYQDQTYFVPGFNTGSRALLPAGAEDICEQLQLEMMNEQEEAYIERVNKQKAYYQNIGATGYNYYGMPYAYAYYNDPAITAKYKKQIEDMRKEAIEARTTFNKNLSKLARNYIGEDYTDEEIDQLYEGKYVTIPATVVQYSDKQAKLSAMQPVDTSYGYRQHHANVSQSYKKHFSNDTDMNTFFQEIGGVIAEENLEEEFHRRRDDSVLFDGTSYRTLIRRKIMERNRQEGTTGQSSLPNLGGGNIPFGNSFPTLNQSAKFLDDGTLQITAPSWAGGKDYSIKNSMENGYEENRSLFLQSIYGNTDPLGGGNPNGGK